MGLNAKKIWQEEIRLIIRGQQCRLVLSECFRAIVFARSHFC